METNNNLSFVQQEDSIDIKALVFKALAFWKLFLISIVIAMLTAYFFNKFADPDFEAKATILVGNDELSQNPMSDIMPKMLGTPPIIMQNEIAVIKSFNTVKKAVQKTDWKISYYRYGKIRENQMFSGNPFVVVMDSTHLQATEVKIDIILISNKQYKLIIPQFKNSSLYDYSKNEKSNIIDSLPNGENKIMNFGEKYENGCFSFTLNFIAPYGNDKEFYFYFSSLD